MKTHDIIVVGGGLAGLRAALEINRKNVKVGIISKVHPVRSHSLAAQGGVNAAMGNHYRGVYDSWEKHTFDTIKGSDYLADQDAVAKMCQDAPKRIYELENWGCAFTRTEDGKIAQRPFGGAGFPRTCYVADKTGHAMLHTLYEQAVRYEQLAERGELTFYNEWLALSLIVEDGTICRGVIAMELATGKLEVFKSDAVIFCTGGAGRIYGKTTNAVISTGMGMAIPYWAGVPLKDMEFIQFHPTTLYTTNILMTEGCRGEGGYLLNNKGERFLANYPDSKKLMEIAPRDIVSRNITREILEGRGINNAYVYLDLRHLGEERISVRLPGIRELAINFEGVDPVKEPIPVVPAQHYTMGGIDCNIDCETKIKGLYAAGECACISVHGANRLGGNSLLDTVVFGAIAGEKASDYVLAGVPPVKNESLFTEALKKEEDKINKLLESKGTEDPSLIKEELGTIMHDNVGIFRDKEKLEIALKKVKELQKRYKNIKMTCKDKVFNQELMWNLELKGNLDVAEAIVKGALNREESRGSHFRLDFPTRDDAKFLKHTLCYYNEEEATLDYKDVTLGMYVPKERKY